MMCRKQISLVMVCVLILDLFIGNAWAATDKDLFTFHNGITFGMTKKQVAMLETGKRDYSITYQEGGECYKYTGVENGGIKDCENWYIFSNKDELFRVKMELYPDTDKSIASTTAKSQYTNLNNRLIAKYGTPLGNRNGYTHPVVTKTLEYGFLHSDTFKVVGAMFGAYTYTEYDEWVVPMEAGYTKIEHFMFYYKDGSGTSFIHRLGYQFYSQDEWEQAMNAYTDGL